ncbi:hypothetical protein LCGC14_0378210 [marine sediment metagenome]|uniref:Nucleotide-diphospho-sugar transferase domain-containing protein n=1 Tax=marine sediment metagenome TaxID=412755 RepID=A0A0F9TLB4_9ZZZZ
MNRNTIDSAKNVVQEKITVLIASVVEREAQLKVVLNRLIDQHDLLEIHVVLNWYIGVPEWIKGLAWKVTPHLNPTNKHAHDSIWQLMPGNGYVIICDDDLMYPLDFFDNLIAAIERHERRVVVTAHGSNIVLPAGDYMDARRTYGFSDRQERDIFNDLCGVGCCAFHIDAFGDKQPSLQNFPIPFMRDLYFSLHCAKNNVPIVNVKRPSSWILPLQTLGSTVYEETLNNASLRALKNRVMKEQLLPALYCKNHDGSGQYVLITDYGFDRRLMDKTLQTLDEVSDEQTNIIVFSDELKDYSFNSQGVEAIYDNVKRPVLTQFVTPDERAIGRMGSKVLTCYRFVCGLPNGSKVLMSDADMYFMRDPMKAFNADFDLGVTTRPEPYYYPLNAGIIFMRVTDQLKDYLRFVIENIYTASWPELVSYQKRFGHDPGDKDWNFDQDALCVTYLFADQMKERFGINVVDVGPKYNWCPHSDGTWEQIASGKAKLLRAYHDESVVVLHLKSKLRELVFEGLLP